MDAVEIYHLMKETAEAPLPGFPDKPYFDGKVWSPGRLYTEISRFGNTKMVDLKQKFKGCPDLRAHPR